MIDGKVGDAKHKLKARVDAFRSRLEQQALSSPKEAYAERPELSGDWAGQNHEGLNHDVANGVVAGTPSYTKFNRLLKLDQIDVTTKADYMNAGRKLKESIRKEWAQLNVDRSVVMKEHKKSW